MCNERSSIATLDNTYKPQIGTLIRTGYAEGSRPYQLDYNARPQDVQHSHWMVDCTVARLSSRKHGYGIEYLDIRHDCDLEDLLRNLKTHLRLSLEEVHRIATALSTPYVELVYKDSPDRVSVRRLVRGTSSVLSDVVDTTRQVDGLQITYRYVKTLAAGQ